MHPAEELQVVRVRAGVPPRRRQLPERERRQGKGQGGPPVLPSQGTGPTLQSRPLIERLIGKHDGFLCWGPTDTSAESFPKVQSLPEVRSRVRAYMYSPQSLAEVCQFDELEGKKEKVFLFLCVPILKLDPGDGFWRLLPGWRG